MTDVTQGRIRTVLFGLLLPIARILLRCGVGYTEFADLAKRAFVEAASTDYGVRNRPTNIARVAVMTGLSRKEVSRIRQLQEEMAGPLVIPSVTTPAAVLNEWHLNPRYLDSSGIPKTLNYAGRGPTFSSLVTKITRDIPPGAMRQELLRAGAIRMLEDNSLQAVKRHFVPDAVSEKIVVGMEVGIRKLAETIAFNADPDTFDQARFQRFVEGPLIMDSSQIENLRAAIHDRLSFFSEDLDELLSKEIPKKPPAPHAASVGRRLSVGIYYHEAAE